MQKVLHRRNVKGSSVVSFHSFNPIYSSLSLSWAALPIMLFVRPTGGHGRSHRLKRSVLTLFKERNQAFFSLSVACLCLNKGRQENSEWEGRSVVSLQGTALLLTEITGPLNVPLEITDSRGLRRSVPFLLMPHSLPVVTLVTAVLVG